ncbi:MAG: protein kinase [Blastocatellia bacterium]|nr:protein kinase [Blastocatellia bacterium]
MVVWRLCETTGATGQPVIWAGTLSGSLIRFEGETWTKFDQTSGTFAHKYVRCLYASRTDAGSVLWVGTDEGLLRFDGRNWKTFTAQDGFLDNQVQAVFETKLFGGKPELVASSNRLLFRFDGIRWLRLPNLPPLPHPAVSHVVETTAADGTPSLWIGFQNNGLVRLDSEPGTHSATPSYQWTGFDEKTGFPSNRVWSLATVSQPGGTRSVWIGTSAGLIRIDPYQWRFLDLRDHLADNATWCIRQFPTPAGGPGLWVGTSGGLTCFSLTGSNSSQTSWSFRVQEGLPSNEVWCLQETTLLTGQPLLIAGTSRGLAKFENGRWTAFPIPTTGMTQPMVWCIRPATAPDGSPALWVGTPGEGVWYWSQRQWSHLSRHETGFPSDWIYGIAETQSSAGTPVLWFATGDGLVRLEQGQPRLLDLKSGLPSTSVWGLHVSRTPNGKQYLWIAGNRGAARADLASTSLTWTTLTTESHPRLPDNDIYQITEDHQGRLYLATNRGVARLTPRIPTADDPTEFQELTFTTEDGLPSNECNLGALFTTQNGTVWVGTLKGVAFLNPGQEVAETQASPLVLESALAGVHESLPLRPAAQLPYDQNVVSFEFALLHYSHQAQTVYRTQLVGLDKAPLDWTPDPKIRYTNLAAGTYTFRVWGRGSAGMVTGPVSLAFEIKPAPWQTWWAFGLYGLATLALGYGGLRWRTRRLERRNQMLETKVAERTVQLAEKNDQLDRKLIELDFKNQELDGKNRELDRKNDELARANKELQESQRRAQFIFSALADDLPETVLEGKYRLEAKIGAGGFGAVFRATHLALNRPVAVKIFRPASGEDSRKSLERFRLEGVSACRVNHPNAVQVLDSGVSSEGIAYLVMELLVGRTLAEELADKRHLSLFRAVQILHPLCAVLAEAHAQGIIHRDIKPDNVFLHQSPDGEIVKVVDFGIAKLLQDDTTEPLNLTVTGGIVGTPLYMAPERLASSLYDGQSDVYSVGVMLYQMLCGRPPFLPEGNNLFALMMKHGQEAPPALQTFNPTIPAEVETLVLQTLAKQPQERPSIRELAEKLAHLVSSHLHLPSPETLLTLCKKNQNEIETLTLPPLPVEAKPVASLNSVPPETEHFGSRPPLSEATLVLGTGQLKPSDTPGDGTQDTLVFPAENQPAPSTTETILPEYSG